MKKRLKRTGDHSYTLFSEEYREHYHSLIGAKSEAHQKYLFPFLEKIDISGYKKIKILDPFFGLGYNSFCFLDYFLSKNIHMEIDGVEKDSTLKEYWSTIYDAYPYLKNNSSFKEIQKKGNLCLWIEDINFFLKKRVENCQYKAILHDAFSFYKCPELWSIDLFKIYYDCLEEGGAVMTYSSSKIVRAGLILAGFKIQKTLSLEKGRYGTIAFKGDNFIQEEDLWQDFQKNKTPYRLQKGKNLEEIRHFIKEDYLNHTRKNR